MLMRSLEKIVCVLAIGTSAALLGVGCVSPIEDEDPMGPVTNEEQAALDESEEIGEAGQAHCGGGGYGWGHHGGYWGHGGWGHGYGCWPRPRGCWGPYY